MVNDFFVEFISHDLALKQVERFKYLVKRFNDNKNDLVELKVDKTKEITNLINILNQLSIELESLKKLLPKGERPEVKEEVSVAIPLKKAKKIKKLKKAVKKGFGSDISSIKTGLAQIRDELEKM